jgi:AraC family transcriptional regulator
VYLKDQLERVLIHLLGVHKNVHHHAMSIDRVRPATRVEIYKRLHWALEYMNDHYCDHIHVDRLALQSCFSSFHFKRLFKELFGESPYQYIRKLRIKKACELLQQGLPVRETCRSMGWRTLLPLSGFSKRP